MAYVCQQLFFSRIKQFESYKLHKRSHHLSKAHIQLITRWILGKGPCGPDCIVTDIGRSTLKTRKQVQALHGDDFYFGNFSTGYSHNSVMTVDSLHDVMATTVSETVIGVDDVDLWEEDSMSFSFKLTDTPQFVE